MLLPASSEFVAICRAQVTLLTQGLGASLSVVYLTQQSSEGADTELIPVVAHPESAANWVGQNGLSLMFLHQGVRPPSRRLLSGTPPPEDWRELESLESTEVPPRFDPEFPSEGSEDGARITASFTPGPDLSPEPDLSPGPNYRLPRGDDSSRNKPPIAPPAYTTANPTDLSAQHQLVLPLMHEQAVLGLLVTGRDDRDWTPWEQSEIEQVAKTLALACVLDQRYQWLEQNQQRQRLLRAQQHDATDNLLHQFRNSITALQTFGKLVLKRLLPGDPQHNITSSIVRETARLQELAQQLEAVHEIDVEMTVTPALGSATPALSNSVTHSVEPPDIGNTDTITVPALPVGLLPPVPLGAVQVADVLHPLLASAQAIAQDRQLTLHTQIAPGIPAVWANAPALREVLNNLIENALKYTPSGGQVWVKARQLPQLLPPGEEQDEDWVEITVSDTGPGIPPQDLARLFERHYRGVQAETEIPGTGLGLAIAKSLLDQMHGEIDVVSPAPAPFRRPGLGTGSLFLVRLEVCESPTDLADLQPLTTTAELDPS